MNISVVFLSKYKTLKNAQSLYLKKIASVGELWILILERDTKKSFLYTGKDTKNMFAFSI